MGALNDAFDEGSTVNEEVLRDAGIIKGRYDGLKILGEGEVVLTLNGSSLSVEGSFEGMSSAATGAHIHNGPPAQPGPVIHALEVTQATRGSVVGELTLTEEQVEALHNNEFYIQIHSESNPPGELRGWVFLRSHFDN